MRSAGREDSDCLDGNEQVTRQVDVGRCGASRWRVRHVTSINSIDSSEVVDVRVEDGGFYQGRQRRTSAAEDRVKVAQRLLGLFLDTVRGDARRRVDAYRAEQNTNTLATIAWL